jgi:tRNA1(Val) A37 N6-methylase TrmN6
MTGELDFFGLAYERFFPEVFKAERGQFFTPQPLVELMVDLARVRPGETVLDPTCGSGTFLVIAGSRGADVDGIEVDPELVALCRLNLKLHGLNPRSVRHADLFRDEEDGRWDVILANPPFSVDITHPDALRRFSLAEGRARVSSDELFLEAAWRRLKPGGRLCAVLPRSILANQSHAALREWLEARFIRRAIITLPEGLFRPFGGAAARAGVLVLQKRPAAIQPWLMAHVSHPGFDPTRKVFRRTEPDQLGQLRLALRSAKPGAPTEEGDLHMWVPGDQGGWLPEAMLIRTGIGEDVPRTTLGELATIDTPRVRPSEDPTDMYTEVDLADVDKQTGEVTAARARKGGEFSGTKTCFSEGDIVFGRIRPNLNNVALVRRPDPRLPELLCGSSEWVRIAPHRVAGFVLVAARSSFVRAQLAATEGQTRPRVRASEIPTLEVPLPPADVQVRMDAMIQGAIEQRLAARQVLDAVRDLYEAYGRGELDAGALMQALEGLES